MQDSTLLFENNCEDIGISKSISQLKILPSLFELKDIINNLQHISQNRRFLISEGAKILTLLLLLQAANTVKAPV